MKTFTSMHTEMLIKLWNAENKICMCQYITVYKERIRSFPGNNAFPVSISAIIHPTDHISTKMKKKNV